MIIFLQMFLKKEKTNILTLQEENYLQQSR